MLASTPTSNNLVPTMNDWTRRMPPMATLGPLLALLAACAFFALKTDTFLSGQNFSLVMQQVMVVGLLAVGQTLIILTAASTCHAAWSWRWAPSS
jgi:ABC-type xylose transport system permease subunit